MSGLFGDNWLFQLGIIVLFVCMQPSVSLYSCIWSECGEARDDPWLFQQGIIILYLTFYCTAVCGEEF